MEIENNVNALDSLLDGNTIDGQSTDATVVNTSGEGSEPGQDVPPTGGQSETNESGEPTEGGDPNLELSGEDASADEGAQQQASAQNKAFAQMRVQLTKYDKTLKELAKALGVDGSDPNQLSDNLINLAQTKLAEQNNVPVELYKELEDTKERLAAMETQQNESLAVDKLLAVRDSYGLSQEELVAFAKQLDADGIMLANNPHIDAEYEYYKRNREAIEKKRIAAAVEEALKGSSQADQQSSTPTNLQGKAATGDAKINNVSALNEFLDTK